MPPKTILVIEPDKHEREELAGVLQKLGYSVDSAANSAEGLSSFSDQRQDLVIVEVLLPGMNGLQVCKVVREQGVEWDVKVIVLSKIYQSRAMEHDAINRYRADAYFARPFQLSQLVDQIKALIGGPDMTGRSTTQAAPATAGEPPPRAQKPKPKSKPEPKPAEPHQVVQFIDHPPPPDEGEFASGDLGLILAKLGEEQISCLLELKNEEQTKHIYFSDGKPVFVKSTIGAEALGQMLLADGVITEAQYKDAMVEMAETGKKLGSVIAAMGLITSDELYFHLVAQTRLKIARCFAWSAGHYRIDRDTLYPEEATTFESDPLAVVLEGYREHMDAAPFEKWYEEHKGQFLFLGSPALVAQARMHLTAPERKLLSGANGKRTLGEAVSESELGLMAALRLVGGLERLSVLRLAQVAQGPELGAYTPEAPPMPETPEADPRQESRFRRLKSFFVQMDDLDHFDLLGVDRDAETDQIHAAFLERQKAFHPDTFTLAAPKRVRKMSVTVSRRLQQAYNALRDAESRQRYLHKLEQEETAQGEARKKRQTAPAEDEAPVNREKRAAQDYQDGLVSLEQKRYPQAIESLQSACAGDPKNIEYRVKLTQSMFKFLETPLYTWDDVESAARQALAIDAKRVDMLQLMGQVKGKLGDDEKAFLFFKKALELDPHNQELKREARYAEQRLKKDDKSWSLFGKKS